MANFDRSGMTQAGINLMGKAIGGATIQFTKLVLGDGEMTGEILDLQGVVSPKQNVDVTRIERNDNQCTVGGELLTSSVKQGFFWRECGLYAMDPDVGEILYNYAYSTKPDYIAASDSGMMEEILVSMVATVGSNTNVDITIDTSMVYLTKKDATVVTLSSLGLISGKEVTDEVKLKNFSVLYDFFLVNKHQTVIVDGIYHLKGNSSYDNTEIKNSIILKGQDSISTLYLDGCSFFISDCQEINISNLKLINTARELTIFLKVKYGCKIEQFSFKGCYVLGNVSLLRVFGYSGATSLNPLTTNHGIDNIVISNNVLENICCTFFAPSNTPIVQCDISSNKVRNFTSVIFNFTLDNDHLFGQEMLSFPSTVNYYNNNVFCDDDFFNTLTESQGAYYCALLAEIRNVNYYNNITRGMKAINNIAVYDAYISAYELNYYNNTWENNLCLHQDKTWNELMKSKGSKNKRYTNNRYLVSKEWIEGLSYNGQTFDPEVVSVVTLHDHIKDNSSEIYICDNNIDVYRLKLLESSKPIKKHIFNNNKLIVRSNREIIGYIIFYNANITERVECMNNIITAESDIGLVASRTVNTINPITDIFIMNNIATVGPYVVFVGGSANSITIKGNIFKKPNASMTETCEIFRQRGNFKYTDISNNELYGFKYPVLTSGGLFSNENGIVNRFSYSNKFIGVKFKAGMQLLGIALNNNVVLDSPRTFIIDVLFEKNNGKTLHIKSMVEYGWNGSNNYIKFMSNTNESKEIVFPSSDIIFNYVKCNYIYNDILTQEGSESKYFIRCKNAPTENLIYCDSNLLQEYQDNDLFDITYSIKLI